MLHTPSPHPRRDAQSPSSHHRRRHNLASSPRANPERRPQTRRKTCSPGPFRNGIQSRYRSRSCSRLPASFRAKLVRHRDTLCDGGVPEEGTVDGSAHSASEWRTGVWRARCRSRGGSSGRGGGRVDLSQGRRHFVRLFCDVGGGARLDWAEVDAAVISLADSKCKVSRPSRSGKREADLPQRTCPTDVQQPRIDARRVIFMVAR
jgi:hypothetical protein